MYLNVLGLGKNLENEESVLDDLQDSTYEEG